MISVTSDGKHGSKFTPPCATAMLAQSKVGRVFPCSAQADHVHVDHVSKLLLDSVLSPARLGELSYVLATGNNAIDISEYKQELKGHQGCYTLFLENATWLLWVLRAVELFAYRMVLGRRVAEKINGCYSMYDHFLIYTLSLIHI
eukprot:TRINITY_DN4605_c0_g1_i1.p1 TRINITY_DN4605_c0_g1~~TRINITY_DN4605_c0_g1_i1.p1  ORF type:complete len:145 (+),score=25.22 TRINITY_DN4605_c0_g1_i1:399-833(+)